MFLWSWFLIAATVLASVGDGLPIFLDCCKDCELKQCRSGYSSDLVYAKNSVGVLPATLFSWDCPSDCNYKCQQIVTDILEERGEPLQQFYGKWPFRRVLGMTEIASVILLGLNFYVNYINFIKVRSYMRSIEKLNPEKTLMAWQYCLLLLLSMVGWTCSAMFHIRDRPLLETMDYVAAAAMIVANFNSVAVRLFGLFKTERQLWLRLFQGSLLAVLLMHYWRLSRSWNYVYNMKFNCVFGILSVTLWISHSLVVQRRYEQIADVSPLHMMPYETAVMQKLKVVGLDKTRYIPLVPVVLNLFLLGCVTLELFDFEPIFRLVDSHSLWHLCTVFPPIIWYDWNIWDLELDLVKTA